MATARARIQKRQLIAATMIVCTITPVFNVLTNEPSLRSAIQGAVDGALISLLVGGYLLFVRDGRLRERFRRLGFRTELALSSAIMLALFLAGRAIGLTLTSLEPSRLWTSFADPHLLYALPYFFVLSIAIQFVLQMNRLVGTNVLGYFVSGTYHRPKVEPRIFLFLDLEASTRLAEQLGSARYFELLQRAVDDVSAAVLEAQGEIYQYAGDEVVVTWPLETGVRDANCVRCFFEARAAIERRDAQYRRAFGVVPRFRGGLHGGDVTAGELGDQRRQIVFVGDILNTAARLEEYAKRSDLQLVVSGVLLERLALPPGVEARPCGELDLRGKDARVAAYSLGERTAAAEGIAA
ncbi:MAG: adenylate/guanylate cyclase domain-containing protein [Burkholderiales bacterium]|nr:adenylate/guanylate cyclase domain-containing protein [Burkholderiales bacterium]